MADLNEKNDGVVFDAPAASEPAKEPAVEERAAPKRPRGKDIKTVPISKFQGMPRAGAAALERPSPPPVPKTEAAPPTPPSPPSPPPPPPPLPELKAEPVPEMPPAVIAAPEIQPQPIIIEEVTPPPVEIQKPAEIPEKEKEPEEKKNFLVRPLRTYRDDLTSLIQKGGASYLSMATAEYKARGGIAAIKKPLPYLLIGSIVLIILGIGGATFFYVRSGSAPIIGASFTPTALVFSETKTEVSTSGKTRDELLRELAGDRTSVHQKIGAVAFLYPTTEDANGKRLLTGSEFLRALEVRISPSFLRALDTPFMLGLHEANGNQPFLILKVTDFNQSYAGLLAWEPYLRRDLAPFFGPASPLAPGTGTTTTEGLQNIDTFRDRVVRNKDVRVLFNPDGTIALMYSLVDNNTILLTTNETTFIEILNRLSNTRAR